MPKAQQLTCKNKREESKEEKRRFRRRGTNREEKIREMFGTLSYRMGLKLSKKERNHFVANLQRDKECQIINRPEIYLSI